MAAAHLTVDLPGGGTISATVESDTEPYPQALAEVTARTSGLLVEVLPRVQALLAVEADERTLGE
jgi:hypothetical protein